MYRTAVGIDWLPTTIMQPDQGYRDNLRAQAYRARDNLPSSIISIINDYAVCSLASMLRVIKHVFTGTSSKNSEMGTNEKRTMNEKVRIDVRFL